MSQLPALAPRQSPANTLTGQQSPKAGNNTGGFAASPLMQRTTQDVVALSKNGLDLSAKGMAQRTDALGNATVDAAQGFLSSMTQKMFGDGASIAFDSVDLQAASSFGGAAASVSGANGNTNAAAFSLDENAHFIGKGKITTADGQTFDFEVEVQYQSNISAGALQQTTQASGDQPASQAGDQAGDQKDGTSLPSKNLPPVDFGGNLSDLFKMLGQQLQSSIFNGKQDGSSVGSASSSDGGQAGSLTLRLLNLVQPPKTAATDQATDKSGALAQAYGTGDSQPASAAHV